MVSFKPITRRVRPLCVVAFVSIALFGLLLDQLTKLWAVRLLSRDVVISVIPRLLSLRLLYNPGASFGFGSQHTWVFGLIALVVCVALVVLQLRTTSLAWSIILGLAFAGASGNLIDRVAYADGWFDGKVIDFLDYGWSVGNVADIILVLAAAGVIVLLMLDVPLNPNNASTPENTPENPAMSAGGYA